MNLTLFAFFEIFLNLIIQTVECELRAAFLRGSCFPRFPLYSAPFHRTQLGQQYTAPPLLFSPIRLQRAGISFSG